MMNFIHAENFEIGAAEMSARIVAALGQGRKVLWLVPGGSNIPISVYIMNLVRETVPIGKLGDLTVSLTDERYGPAGHQDSNWEQLDEAGFKFDNISVIPVLRDMPLDATTAAFAEEIAQALRANDLVLGQFGIGADGHIAGILPRSPAVLDPNTVSAYQAEKFTRITLTPAALMRVQAAFAFVFGPSKSEAVARLRDSDLTLEEQPSQVLKMLPESYLFSDQA